MLLEFNVADVIQQSDHQVINCIWGFAIGDDYAIVVACDCHLVVKSVLTGRIFGSIKTPGRIFALGGVTTKSDRRGSPEGRATGRLKSIQESPAVHDLVVAGKFHQILIYRLTCKFPEQETVGTKRFEKFGEHGNLGNKSILIRIRPDIGVSLCPCSLCVGKRGSRSTPRHWSE